MEINRAEFDLILHSEIDIARSAAVVWPYLDRLREWKDSVVSVERAAGKPDEVGGVLRIGQRPGTQTVYVLQKTLGLQVPRWRVQTLETEDGITTSGYICYSLVESAGHTQVICSVAARVRVPASSAEQAGGIEKLALAANVDTQTKLDADHRALKQLVERS